MNKAFTKEDEKQDESLGLSRFVALAEGVQNIITPSGHERLRNELDELVERRENLGVHSDESSQMAHNEAMLQLKAQIQDLEQRLKTHVVLDFPDGDIGRVVFGTQVDVRDEEGDLKTYALVGLDETDPEIGRISWSSPLAKALANQEVGSIVQFRLPSIKGQKQQEKEFEILKISTLSDPDLK